MYAAVVSDDCFITPYMGLWGSINKDSTVHVFSAGLGKIILHLMIQNLFWVSSRILGFHRSNRMSCICTMLLAPEGQY